MYVFPFVFGCEKTLEDNELVRLRFIISYYTYNYEL